MVVAVVQEQEQIVAMSEERRGTAQRTPIYHINTSFCIPRLASSVTYYGITLVIAFMPAARQSIFVLICTETFLLL